MAVKMSASSDVEESKSVRNVDKGLLDHFWNLVETKEVRIKAALGIIRLLQRKQESISETGNAKSLELGYVIDRLVKGICSTRKAARQGYAVTLTQVMKLFPAVDISEIISLISKHLPISNRQDKSQLVIGQLLAYSAIIRSDRVKNDVNVMSTIVSQLYDLSLGRSYIQETAYRLMCLLFAQINEEHFKELIWPTIRKKVSCGWETCMPDILWFLLLCLRIYPNAVTEKFLMKNWGGKDILSNENFDNLQQIVKKSTSVHPQFPPVCSELIHLMFQKKKPKKIWNAIFDATMFESDQNEKTYLGFKVIEAALSNGASKKMVSTIISPNFSSILTRCLLSNKHPMNSAASELAKFLGNYVKESADPHSQVVILKAFIQPPGTVLLEQMLNKKEVSLIIRNLSCEAVKICCEVLQSLILQKPPNNQEDQESLNRKRCQAVSQIGTLISHTAVVAEIEWREQVIKFLFLHSFFEIKEHIEGIEPNWMSCNGSEICSLDASVRQACMHSFNRALDSLNRRSDSSVSPLDQQLAFLKSLAKYAEIFLLSSDQVKPLQPLEKISAPWKSMMRTIKKLGKQSLKDGKNIESAAFQIFLLQLGLQLFSDADHIPGILDELQVCCKRAIQKRKDKGTEDEDDLPWVQVVVDVMLSLISQESHHMRCVVNSVFSIICPFVTQEALQQILDVINPEIAADDSILMANSEDEGDDDVEFESGSSSEDDVEDEKEGKIEKNEAVDNLKLKVQEALGEAADVSDAESEVVMTDSEMTQLDEALSAAFRGQRKVGHLQFSSEQETLMHFRLRCLDLISIFLKTEPPMASLLICILPVLSAYLFGEHSRHQRPLAQKALSTLQFLLKAKKFRDCNGVEGDQIRKILQDLMDKANKETNAPVGKILNSLCVYMVLCERKLVVSTDKESTSAEEPSCLNQYRTALDVFVNKINSHFTANLFVALMNSCPDTAWSFVNSLQNYAFDENVRLFKKAQCLGLLVSSLRFSKGQKSVTPKMWQKTLEPIVPKTVQSLILMLEGKSNVKPTYTIELIESLITIKDIIKEKNIQTVEISNKDKLIEVLVGLSSAPKKRLGQQGKRSINKLIRLLGGEVPLKQKKRKLDEDETCNVESMKKSKVDDHVESELMDTDLNNTESNELDENGVSSHSENDDDVEDSDK